MLGPEVQPRVVNNSRLLRKELPALLAQLTKIPDPKSDRLLESATTLPDADCYAANGAVVFSVLPPLHSLKDLP